MATRRRSDDSASESAPKRHRPATTVDAREAQLVELAYDLAERQIREGTASSQVVVQFLKLGSSRERLEQQKIRSDNEINMAKIEGMKASQRVEALYKEALDAMRSYAGQEPLPEPEFDF
jgi:hypothetical protein